MKGGWRCRWLGVGRADRRRSQSQPEEGSVPKRGSSRQSLATHPRGDRGKHTEIERFSAALT